MLQSKSAKILQILQSLNLIAVKICLSKYLTLWHPRVKLTSSTYVSSVAFYSLMSRSVQKRFCMNVCMSLSVWKKRQEG